MNQFPPIEFYFLEDAFLILKNSFRIYTSSSSSSELKNDTALLNSRYKTTVHLARIDAPVLQY